MPRAPVPFCGCVGTPHGRGSFAERGVGTWRRRNLSGTVSVTWRSVPGGCRRRARLVLTAVPVGPGRCWLFLLRSDLDAAGSSCFGARERRVKGNGMAGVPSQGEGTGQEEKGESGKAGVPSHREGTGQGNGESGKAGVPSQWEGTGQENGESGKAGVPSQREGTGQENGESGLSARSEAESESARRGPFIATVGLRAARDSRLGRWGSSAQRGVRVLSAGRNTGSGADSVDAVRAVGSALIFCTGSEKERNFSATGSVS
ncbi:hypothetical protein GEV33_006858 [Tenebrio molitor]|uniref:Uncharacterized protein n=1 Tax=Tenebrio molitor TaxID=7067 RepID=A0A8J6LDL8_TENMO|nr:hypothetical protein GEV33_006858 [Tenebrio molitor]